MLYRKDNQANFMQPSDRGTSPSTFDYDNFSADLEQTCLACEYLAELSGSMESTVASLGSLPSATGIDKDGNYAQALKCVKGGSGLSGFGGSVTSAYNRAKAVRNAILRAQGISEDLFDQKGKEIAYGLLGIEMPEEVVQDTPQAHVDAWEALRESDPEAYREQAAAGAAAAQAKNPEDWTIDDVLALLAYQEDLSGRYSTAEREFQEIAGWDWGTGISDDAHEKYTALKNEKKALEDLLKANGLMDYTFAERAWQDISAAGQALISEGADVFHAIGEGDFRGALTELGEFNTQLYATGAVVTEATISGGAKLLEYVDDGSHMLMGALATPYTYLADQIAGTDITGTMWDAVMDDVARDKVGEAREWFYEGTALGRAINENSALSYDSAGAQGIMNVSTKGAEIVAATAVTVCTGGAAAPFLAAGIGFLEGMGQEGERRFSLTDADGNYTNRTATDVALSALKGVGKASEWYMYGNVGANLVNGALGTAGASGAVDMANLTGNNARDALTRLVRSGDFYLDMASSAANAATTRITTGKWNWGEMALDFGLSILGNYGGEYLNVAQANKARAAAMVDLPGGQADDMLDAASGHKPFDLDATPKLSIDPDATLPGKPFDLDATVTLPDVGPTPKLSIDPDATLDPGLFDPNATAPMFGNSPTPILANPSNNGGSHPFLERSGSMSSSGYTRHPDYDDFVAANAANRRTWEAGLSDREKELIIGYIGEDHFASGNYAAVNGYLRGDLVDLDAQTITFRHAYGADVIPLADFEQQLLHRTGETVPDFVARVGREADELQDAVLRSDLGRDTVVYRGVGTGTIKRNFGIDVNSSSLDEIVDSINSQGGFHDAAFMSSTPASTGGFTGKDVVLVMDCDAETKVADFYRWNSCEEEILIAPGQNFEALGAQWVERPGQTPQLQIHLRRK